MDFAEIDYWVRAVSEYNQTAEAAGGGETRPGVSRVQA